MIWRKHSEYSFSNFPSNGTYVCYTQHMSGSQWKPLSANFIFYVLCNGIKGWYWPQGLLSMPTDDIHKSWETPSAWHRSALPANPTSSCPQSWSLGNATLVVAERSGWGQVLSTSKLRLLAKVAHPYRKWACLEALRLATTKLTQQGTDYPSWGHTTQLRSSRGSTELTYT